MTKLDEVLELGHSILSEEWRMWLVTPPEADPDAEKRFWANFTADRTVTVDCWRTVLRVHAAAAVARNPAIPAQTIVVGLLQSFVKACARDFLGDPAWVRSSIVMLAHPGSKVVYASDLSEPATSRQPVKLSNN